VDPDRPHALLCRGARELTHAGAPDHSDQDERQRGGEGSSGHASAPSQEQVA
jgi:hypothetical protein